MNSRRLRAPIILLTAAMLTLTSGCGSILNPSFLNFFGINTTVALEAPVGDIIILVMNQGSDRIVMDIAVTKDSGSVMTHTIALSPYRDASGEDWKSIVQQCDVFEIEVLRITVSLASGDLVDIPANIGVLQKGRDLFCGNVLAITIFGIGGTPTAEVW